MRDLNFTYYASAQRLPISEIRRQYNLVLRNASSVYLVDELSIMVALLNRQRQIVWANRSLLGAAQASADEAIGKRLGELFRCVHSAETNGCGTSAKCASCGAVRTMVDSLGSQDNKQFIRDCCLVSPERTFDLRVSSSLTALEGQQFILCSVTDIADEKRREVMERIFFHDILNSVYGIGGMVQALVHYHKHSEAGELAGHLQQMVAALINEIGAHKILTQIEKGMYEYRPAPIQTLDMLRAEAAKYGRAARVGSKWVEVDPESENHGIVTDWALLSRVLGAMFRNAMEAETAGAVITAGTYNEGDEVVFYVHNPAVIDPAVALQVFERSFSTKGPGRGLGTYGMKLLSEQYLGGKIGFASSPEEGTRFEVRLPFK